MRAVVMWLAERLDHRFGWERLPRGIGVLTLIGLRERLRERNLYAAGPSEPPTPEEIAEARRAPGTSARTVDGRFNDLEDPRMGSAGAAFGRNAPGFAATDAQITGHPDPRQVSLDLLTRDAFLPATTLNLLAAAWLQFEVHDWFSHQTTTTVPREAASGAALRDPGAEADWRLEEAPRGRRASGPDPGQGTLRSMRLPRMVPDPASSRDVPRYLSVETHWWDASQLYGTDREFAQHVREDGGRLKVDADHLRAIERATRSSSGTTANLWVGLALLHVLFAREHNALADRLRDVYPGWTDERIFQKARLINAALMAKIHTVEWTPAVVAHPTTSRAARAMWSGVRPQRLRGRWDRIGRSAFWSGIPGSATDHHGVPYSLTEEFVAVYRMHPLMPEDVAFHSVATDAAISRMGLPDLVVAPGAPGQPRERLEAIGYANALYSLGVANPGAITLHNFPRFLQSLERGDTGEIVDVGAADILRIRESRLPRYNDFRRLFRLPPAASFTDLTDNRRWAEQIREVYDDDLEAVDLMIGLFGEPRPRGLAFSQTAFRVFLLMAARRLQSDRFFTRDYTAETYTPTGLDWIDRTSMADVLRRHHPELGPALEGVDNAFVPWRRARRERPTPRSP